MSADIYKLEDFREAEDISTEELKTVFIGLKQKDVENAFKKGQIVHYLLYMGETKSALASEFRCSSQHISDLVKTYEAFPTEEDRPYHELDFSHYKVAKGLKNPHYWLRMAEYYEWSVREMKVYVKDQPMVADEFRKADAALDRIKGMLDEGNEVSAYLHKGMLKLINQYVFEGRDKEVV